MAAEGPSPEDGRSDEADEASRRDTGRDKILPRLAAGAGIGTGVGILASFPVADMLEDSGLAFVVVGSLDLAIGVLVALFRAEG